MATIKDIAKLAGVSHGTVSNVLNRNGNVSSAKIMAVQKAAEQLGYVINNRARSLRENTSHTLALLLPNRTDKKYTDLYRSFSTYAANEGYDVSLFFSEGIIREEERCIQEIRSLNVAGLAVMTGCASKNLYENCGYEPEQILYLNHCMDERSPSIAFDYSHVGKSFAKVANRYKNVTLITSDAQLQRINELLQAFYSNVHSSCHVTHYERKSYLRSSALCFDILSADPAPEALFTTSTNIAKLLRDINQNFLPNKRIDIYSLSSLYTLPESDFCKYELNFRLMGKEAARTLIDSIKGKELPQKHVVLKNDGFCQWQPKHKGTADSLTLLTMDSPAAYIMQQMSGMYTQATGTSINVVINNYDSLYEILQNGDVLSPYDIIRIDSNWLPFLAPKIYTPLEQIASDIYEIEKDFFPKLMNRYGIVDNTLYALPETPCAQMLFYNKDLFNNSILQRFYRETIHSTLEAPVNFDDYNRIARFFTRKFNPDSPTTYGSTLTLGNTSTITTEYLSRFFALRTSLVEDDGSVHLVTEEGIHALEQLMEVSQYAPFGHRLWWRDTAKLFAQGDIAMTLMFTNYASELLGEDTRTPTNVGYAISPGNNPLLGGGSIGVGRESKHKKEALRFIRWICSREISTAMTLLGSVSPCRKTYDSYHIIDNYPWLAQSEACFELAHGQRLPSAQARQFSDRALSSILGTHIAAALNKAVSPREALERAQRKIENELYHK